MSEPTNEPTTVPPTSTTTENPPADEPLGEAGKAALAAERAARREADREKAALAAKLKEYEDRDKSELQRLAEENAELRKDNEAKTLKVLRAEVSAAKGVPANLIGGTTREEMETSADAVLAFKGVTRTAPPADGQGNVGDPVNGGSLDTQIAAAREAGNVRLALSLTNQKLLPRKD